ncbi:YqjD family protein [Legionella lytica]|uniref:YqjD family protein n=1 Tax=Legionella lytica TaxID=96232 RepID=A0ABW8DBV6_9GAMM
MDNFDHLKDKVKDNAEDMLNKAKEKTEGISDTIKKQACDAQKNIECNYDELVEHIKEKPIASVLIAAGVGYLVSKLLK